MNIKEFKKGDVIIVVDLLFSTEIEKRIGKEYPIKFVGYKKNLLFYKKWINSCSIFGHKTYCYFLYECHENSFDYFPMEFLDKNFFIEENNKCFAPIEDKLDEITNILQQLKEESDEEEYN